MKVLSGIDLPYSMSCGSMILASDLYSRPGTPFDARFLSLSSDEVGSAPGGWRHLDIDKAQSHTAPDVYRASLSRAVREQFDAFEPDVIHCQHLCYGMSLALLDLPRRPRMALCHGTDVIEALRAERHQRDLQYVVDNVDRVIFPSRGILNDARRVATVAEDKAFVVPWGIPDSYFVQPARGPSYSDKPFRVLYAGRLDPSKGIDDLVAALAQLPPNYELCVVGRGPEYDRIAELSQKHRVSNRLRLEGWLPRSALQALFCDFQLLVLPSREIEAFGLVCVEAQAAGLPVIVSDMSGLPEVLPLDSEGFSFAGGDPAALAQAIRNISADPEVWRRAAAHCRDNSERFSLSACVDRVYTLTSELVGASGKK